jgi:hypothetical protein
VQEEERTEEYRVERRHWQIKAEMQRISRDEKIRDKEQERRERRRTMKVKHDERAE